MGTVRLGGQVVGAIRLQGFFGTRVTNVVGSMWHVSSEVRPPPQLCSCSACACNRFVRSAAADVRQGSAGGNAEQCEMVRLYGSSNCLQLETRCEDFVLDCYTGTAISYAPRKEYRN